MKRTVIELILILCVSAIVFFTNLGKAQLWDRDEPRNAGCAAEMMERADLVVPIFNDELRHQKPVLLYWLMMGAYWLLGFSEFSARLPSAISAVGSVIATYVIARRLAGHRVAFLSAVILSTSLMFVVAARAATPDSVLIFCNSIAILIYVLAVFNPFAGSAQLRDDTTCFPQNRWLVILMYSFMGLGVLAKGPVGFVIPTAVIGLFCLIVRLPGREEIQLEGLSIPSRIMLAAGRLFRMLNPVHFAKTVWLMRPVTAIVVVILVAGPWYWLVNARTEGDFTRLFFVGEHFGRATTAFENHRGGLWFYPLAILIGFFPWSVFWVPVAAGIWREKKSNGISLATLFLLCWIGVQVGLFSIAQTKLPSYVTPCYGALAMLTAICLVHWQQGHKIAVSNKWISAGVQGMLIGGVLIFAGLAFACRKYLEEGTWIALLGLVPLLGAIVAFFMIWTNRRGRVVLCSVSVGIIFCIGVFGFAATTVSNHQANRQILDLIREKPPEITVAAYGVMESSWVVYAGRPIYELATEVPSQTTTSIRGMERSKNWRPKPRLIPEEFVAASPNAMFITTCQHLGQLKKRLPGDYRVIQAADYFFRDKTLYLLAREQVSVNQDY